MAIYKRTYKPYGGRATREWTRFLILPRYSFPDLMSSRPLMMFFFLSFIPTLIGATIIYLANNESARALLELQSRDMVLVDNFFFGKLLSIQSMFAFLIAAWIGPGLVSVDLNNDALPLFLCRPFSRVEYVLGKMTVLVGVLSLVTWIPAMLLFLMQSNMAPAGWMAANLRIAFAIIAGAWMWIAILSLLALALSAWVKWRVAATALMLAVFFVPAGFGEAANEVLSTNWGKLLNLGYLMNRVWFDLFGVNFHNDRRRVIVESNDIPVLAAWIALVAICGLCLLMLNKRLRAREVVRG